MAAADLAAWRSVDGRGLASILELALRVTAYLPVPVPGMDNLAAACLGSSFDGLGDLADVTRLNRRVAGIGVGLGCQRVEP